MHGGFEHRPDETGQHILLITGPSGGGHTTAINALEDLGFEVIDNLPLSLLPRLIEGPPMDRPMALGLDVRNRDFSTDALINAIDTLATRSDLHMQVVYLDADEGTLVRRFSETRRKHPLAVSEDPLTGIARESALLGPVRARADVLIDTSGLSPHDLKREIGTWFGPASAEAMAVRVQSFSYKRGLPRGLDIVMDCRFLRNPHWEPALRALDGRDPAVADYVASDPNFAPFFDNIAAMMNLLLPAFKDEGKAYLSIGFGCTGGQHRSVAVAERLAKSLAEGGWQVSKRHRELERKTSAGQTAAGRTDRGLGA